MFSLELVLPLNRCSDWLTPPSGRTSFSSLEWGWDERHLLAPPSFEARTRRSARLLLGMRVDAQQTFPSKGDPLSWMPGKEKDKFCSSLCALRVRSTKKFDTRFFTSEVFTACLAWRYNFTCIPIFISDSMISLTINGYIEFYKLCVLICCLQLNQWSVEEIPWRAAGLTNCFQIISYKERKEGNSGFDHHDRPWNTSLTQNYDTWSSRCFLDLSSSLFSSWTNIKIKKF